MSLRTLDLPPIQEDRAAALKAWQTRQRRLAADPNYVPKKRAAQVTKPKRKSMPDSWEAGHTDYSFEGSEVENNVVGLASTTWHVFEEKGFGGKVKIDANLPNKIAIHYMNQLAVFHSNGWNMEVKIHDRPSEQTNEGRAGIYGTWHGGISQIEIFEAANSHPMNETIHHELSHAVYDAWRDDVQENSDDLEKFAEYASFIKDVDSVLKPRDLTAYLSTFWSTRSAGKRRNRYTETLAAMAQVERSPDPERQLQWQSFQAKYPNLTKIYYNVRKNIG